MISKLSINDYGKENKYNSELNIYKHQDDSKQLEIYIQYMNLKTAFVNLNKENCLKIINVFLEEFPDLIKDINNKNIETKCSDLKIDWMNNYRENERKNKDAMIKQLVETNLLLSRKL